MVRKLGGCVLSEYLCSVRSRFVLLFRDRDLGLACPPVHLLSHPHEFSTFQAWFWFLPFSSSHIVSIRNFPPVGLAEMLSLGPVSHPRVIRELRLPSPLSWGQLAWTPKKTKYGSGKEEREHIAPFLRKTHLRFSLPLSVSPTLTVHRRLALGTALEIFQNTCGLPLLFSSPFLL